MKLPAPTPVSPANMTATSCAVIGASGVAADPAHHLSGLSDLPVGPERQHLASRWDQA